MSRADLHDSYCILCSASLARGWRRHDWTVKGERWLYVICKDCGLWNAVLYETQEPEHEVPE